MKHIFLFVVALLIAGCKTLSDASSSSSIGGYLQETASNLNLFPISKDVELGAQAEAQFANDPNIKILPRGSYPKAYGMIDQMVSTILNSGKLKNKALFAWKFYIIEDDVLNAFCTPGGYIYVYTGLIKYLNTVDDLAGVIGHEIAHADERHSTTQLTKQYGIEFLSGIALGNKSQGMVGQFAKKIASLKFSRTDESESDARSVDYLCRSSFKADGAATFFKKIGASQQPSLLGDFMSTHPSPDNRVENITKRAKDLGCNLTPNSTINYQEVIAELP